MSERRKVIQSPSTYSVEFFAAKDLLAMTVPAGCGLKLATKLVVSGLELKAMAGSLTLPVRLCEITSDIKQMLVDLVALKKSLIVSELTAIGPVAVYLLPVEIIN